MDSFTLIAADLVLKVGGIRAAARLLDCPAATIAAAFGRLESSLATPIAERTGSRLALTLEGRRLALPLDAAARLAERLGRLNPAGFASTGGRPVSVSLGALERFVWVAKAGSIRRAAREIGVGQPQLSRQMSNLEAALQTPLFRRSAEGVELSAEGAELARLAEELAEIWQALTHKASDRFRRTRSTVRLGAIMLLGHESTTAKLLAKLAAQWQANRSRAALFISNATAQELLMGLQNGGYDLALLDTTALPAHLETTVISRSPLVLVGNSPRVWPEGADVADVLTRAPIAATSLKSGLRQKLDQFLERYLSPTQRERVTLFEIDSLPTIINLVLDHGFLSVLPTSAMSLFPGPLSYLQLDSEFDQELVLAWPQTAPARRAAEQVLSLLQSR